MRRRTIFDDLYSMMSEMEMDMGLSWNLADGCMEPLVYVDETDSEVIVTADLPCVGKRDIKLNATENSLELEAKAKKPFKFERWGFPQKTCCFDSFKKVVNLRSRTEPKKAKATFKKGILKVVIPKVRTKYRIEIK